MGRLRAKLREYYATEGGSEPVVIDVPKGQYAPRIRLREGSAYTLARDMPSRTFVTARHLMA
jgi:hypothetical protein